MRSLAILLTLLVAGCTEHDSERVAFDQLLASNRIGRIETAAEAVVYKVEMKTNVLTGEHLSALIHRLSATNRIANPVRHKSYISGYISFYEGETFVGMLHYFPAERVLSYRGYQFSLLDTNEIRPIFRLPF